MVTSNGEEMELGSTLDLDSEVLRLGSDKNAR